MNEQPDSTPTAPAQSVELQRALDGTTDLALQIVNLAANKDLDVSKLEALIAMRERMLKTQAEAAFTHAFAAMQIELPVILKTQQGDQGKWAYAPLDEIFAAIRPVLFKYGFSISHKTEWPSDKVIKVTGILSHRLGHQRISEFISAADSTGSKNAIQSLGSSQSYGRRYTTLDLVGCAAADDDGQSASTARPAVEDPKGFRQWADEMVTLGQEQGLAPLEAAWKKAPKHFKEHMAEYYAKQWDEVKRNAAKVPR